MKKITLFLGFLLMLTLSGCGSQSGFMGGFLSSDDQLVEEIQQRYMMTGDPVLSQVQVEAMNRHVILSGYVKKIKQSDMAELLARQVQGVDSVENNIIVKSGFRLNA